MTAHSTAHPLATVPTARQAEELRRTVHHEADAVVIGAGISGCAIAITLARQGRSVILLERSLKEPDRIVGELLQPGGLSALETLGLRDCLEEIDAVPVYGYSVIYHGQPVNIPYPDANGSAKGQQKQDKPEGRSFHHGRFIRRLREVALKTPNLTVVETTVTNIVKSGYSGQVVGVECETKADEEGKPPKRDCYFGELTFIADGYASKFRKDYIKHQPVAKSRFWGLELIDVELPDPKHGHVILSDDAPVLLYQIGTHETRALVDIPDNLPTASVAQGGVKGHLRNVVLPKLPKSVQASFEEALNKGGLRSMPNSWLPPSTNIHPGLVMLGDSMNMRHPLTGGGMTVAFNDVVLLSDLLSPERIPSLADQKAVLSALSTFHWRRKNLTSVINILAQALYALFAANDPYLRALQLGCFRYFQLGGACVEEPVGLLAGIIRRPFVLFYHFFAVALLSIWIKISESSFINKPRAMLASVGVFYKACVVIFPYIFSELRS